MAGIFFWLMGVITESRLNASTIYLRIEFIFYPILYDPSKIEELAIDRVS